MYVSNNPNNITPNIERRLRLFISLCNNLRYRQIPTFVCRTTGEFIIQVCLCLDREYTPREYTILLVRATSDYMQSKNVRKNTFAISRTTFNIVGFKCVFYYTISTETDFGLTYIHKQRKLNIWPMAGGHTIFVSSQGSCSFYQFLLYRIVSYHVASCMPNAQAF